MAIATCVDLAESEPLLREPAKTWFELRLVDEIGQPIDEVGVVLRVDGEDRPLTTDLDGKVRVEDATLGFASARVQADDVRPVVKPRWDQIREGAYHSAAAGLMDRVGSLSAFTTREKQILRGMA